MTIWKAGEERCSACRYWRRAKPSVWAENPDKPPQFGRCHRYAPRGPEVGNTEVDSCEPFVSTHENDFCGDFAKALPVVQDDEVPAMQARPSGRAFTLRAEPLRVSSVPVSIPRGTEQS